MPPNTKDTNTLIKTLLLITIKTPGAIDRLTPEAKLNYISALFSATIAELGEDKLNELKQTKDPAMTAILDLLVFGSMIVAPKDFRDKVGAEIEKLKTEEKQQGDFSKN